MGKDGEIGRGKWKGGGGTKRPERTRTPSIHGETNVRRHMATGWGDEELGYTDFKEGNGLARHEEFLSDKTTRLLKGPKWVGLTGEWVLSSRI